MNAEVKYLESWRPFCPSMTGEVKEKYLESPNEASFMVVAYHANSSVQEKLSSVVHVDGTVRPQAVSLHTNPLFHRLLENMGKRTGHPVVLNTSLNVWSEPIICTPLEVVRCFYSTGLDVLVVGDFLLQKPRG